MYRLRDVPGDGLCFFHSVCLDYTDGVINGGRELRVLLAQATCPESVWYHGLSQILTAKKMLFREGYSIDELYRHFTVESVSAREYVGEEHMLVYSIVTGNRVVCLMPYGNEVIVRYDTLGLWESIVDGAARNGWNLPSMPGVLRSSFCHYVYYHKANEPARAVPAEYNHYANLEFTHELQVRAEGLTAFYLHTPTGIMPIREEATRVRTGRGYDKSRPEGSAPGGRSNRVLNEKGKLRRRRQVVESDSEDDFSVSSYERKLARSEVKRISGSEILETVAAKRKRKTETCPGQEQQDRRKRCKGETGRSDLVDTDDEGEKEERQERKKLYKGKIGKDDLVNTDDEREQKNKESIRKAKESRQRQEKRNRTGDELRNDILQGLEQEEQDDKVGALLERFVMDDFSMNPERLTELLREDPQGKHLFADCLKSPHKAVLLHYLNSGLFGFQRWKEYCESWDGISMDDKCKAELKEEIQQMKLSDQEMKELVERYSRLHSYREGLLPSCGSCGIRQWERPADPAVRYERVYLNPEEDEHPLRYTPQEEVDFSTFVTGRGNTIKIPVDARGTTKDVELWRARSVYTDNGGRRWHVHPELVDSGDKHASTLVCPHCYASLTAGKRPALSVANGLDLGSGSRLGLTTPNLHEQLILARSRLFFAAVKLTSNRKGQCNFNVTNRFKCHAILFPGNEAETIPYMANSDIFGDGGLFDFGYLRKLLAVYCLDESLEPDELMQFLQGSNELVGRPWVLAQWILVLQRLNRFYYDIDVTRTEAFVAEIARRVEMLSSFVAKGTVIIDDPIALQHEFALGSDVTESQQVERNSDSYSTTGYGTNKYRQSMRYSYVTSTQTGHYNDSKTDPRVDALYRFVVNGGDKEEEEELIGRGNQDSVEIVNMSYVLEMQKEEEQDQEYGDTDTMTDNTESETEEEAQSVFSGGDVGCSVSVASLSQQCRKDPKNDDADTFLRWGTEDETHYKSKRSFDRKQPGTESVSVESRFPGRFYEQEDLTVGGTSTIATFQGNLREYNVSDASSEAQEFPSWEKLDNCYDGVPVAGAESARKREPVNEFAGDVDHCRNLSTCFPHIFMLGNSLKKHPGRYTPEERYHLLHQYTLVPAQDRRFLAYLFDKKQRISVFDGVNAYVDSSRTSIRVIEDLLQDSEKRKELQKACLDPEAEGNWKLLKKYIDHLRFASRDVAFGAAEGAKYEWRALEMNKRYSCPTCFLTISPPTLDNPRAIRLAFRTSSNNEFPALFEDGCPYGESSDDFIERLRKNTNVTSEGLIRLPRGFINKSFRADLAMTNPIAFVQENKNMLSDIFSILLGMEIEDSGFYSRNQGKTNRSTRYYKSRKGVFGHPLYAIGVTEDHKKGTLHWHISLSAGLPAYVLQRFGNLTGICNEISDVLNQMYVSDIPEDMHIGTLLRKALLRHQKDMSITPHVLSTVLEDEPLLFGTKPQPDLEIPNAELPAGPYVKRLMRCATLFASYRQYHRHCSTCFKTKRGKMGCRLDYPVGACERTRGIGILWRPRPPPGYSTEQCGTCKYIANELIPTDKFVFKNQPVLEEWRQDPLIIWETKHPGIVPTVLPVPPADGHVPAIVELREAFRRAVLRLPNFQLPRSEDLHNWLYYDATDEEILKIWKEIIEELPWANRMVPSFNPIISYCTGSHNNASLLGSIQQAKSALFYLVPYQGKSKHPIREALPILNNALSYVDYNESKHPTEAGTLRRTMKQLLQRTLNRMNLKMEISDYEIAASLLELPSVISSDRFIYGHPKALNALRTALDTEMTTGKVTSHQQAFRDLCDRLEAVNVRQKRDNKDVKWSRINDIIKEDEEASRVREQAENLMCDYGFIKKIKIKGEKDTVSILVPEVSLYLYRSEQLEDLSYYEYLGCVETKTGKKSESTKRSRQTRYALLPSFHGSNEIYQVLSQKQRTPLFIGPPPKHPGKQPTEKDQNTMAYVKALASWKAEADRYARYYLTLFKPHRLESPMPSDAWEYLKEWIRQLRQDSTITSKFRLMMMHQHMRGMTTSPKDRIIAREYRSRGRKLWSSEQKLHQSCKDRLRSGFSNIQNDLTEIDLDSSDILTETQKTNMRKQLEHEEKQMIQMKEMFEESPLQQKEFVKSAQDHYHSSIAHPGRTKDVMLKQRKLQTFKGGKHLEIKSDKWWSKASNRRRARRKVGNLRNALKKPNSQNTQQMQLFNLYSKFFLREEGATKPPQMLLCHGGPGVGKSVVRKYIDDAAKACGRFRHKTSFNAINAIEMGGNTTASELNLNASKHANFVGDFQHTKRDGDRIRDLRNAGFDKNAIVIIEEISNQAPWHLARLSRMCQEVVGDFNQPFGGVLVLMFGDLKQLGPVKAVNLTCAVMDVTLDLDLHTRVCKNKQDALGRVSTKEGDRPEYEKYYVDHPHYIGSQLMTQVRYFELTQQQRSEDDCHTAFVTSNSEGNRITVNDIKEKGYKILSKKDSEDMDWIRAPILVSTNRERQTLTEIKAKQFAKATGTVVVRWLTKYRNWKQRPLLECHRLQALQDPCFYEYFVVGADAFLTENIQKSLKLTNATAAKYHSLVLDHQTERKLMSDLAGAKPGSQITLLHTPIAVNMEIQIEKELLDDKAKSVLKATNVAAPKFDPEENEKKKNYNTYVLPIWAYSCKSDSSESIVRATKAFPASKVTLTRHFPIEPAFAITVHKSEGRTMDRVIIALSSCRARGCDFNYAQVHVAFSRVRQGEHIRLLLTGRMESDQWESITYLGTLKRKPSIDYYFKGFRDTTQGDCNEDWMDDRWNRQKANDYQRAKLLGKLL